MKHEIKLILQSNYTTPTITIIIIQLKLSVALLIALYGLGLLFQVSGQYKSKMCTSYTIT